jgi:hypothetical protein
MAIGQPFHIGGPVQTTVATGGFGGTGTGHV